MRYRVEVSAKATILETWLVEWPDHEEEPEAEDLLGLLDTGDVADQEITGDEEDREVVSWEEVPK